MVDVKVESVFFFLCFTSFLFKSQKSFQALYKSNSNDNYGGFLLNPTFHLL